MLGFKLGRNVARTARASGIPLRYGTGIYFSSVSGKANYYARLSAKVRLMIGVFPRLRLAVSEKNSLSNDEALLRIIR